MSRTAWIRKNLAGSSDVEFTRVLVVSPSHVEVSHKSLENPAMIYVRKYYPALADMMVFGENAEIIDIRTSTDSMYTTVITVRLKPLEVMQLALVNGLPPTKQGVDISRP
jgi:hypothetical protein